MREFLSYIIIGINVIFVCSCASPKTITVKESTQDTLIINNHDTLRIYDFHTSVDTLIQNHVFYITQDAEGNVIREKEVHDTYRSSVKNDSTDYYRSLCDSLKSVNNDSKIETITIQQKLSWFDRFKKDSWTFLFVLSILLSIILYISIRLNKDLDR